ncbi:MAG: cytochrome bc complex cytochrome b subunit [Calditrichaeota bacterium]|nr:cytochrome bc complex cytochrome b subunit [Calditrichota bacterium]
MSVFNKEWWVTRVPVDYEKVIGVIRDLVIKEPIPVHMKRWYYAMGATPLILFLLQVTTGLLLTFYYVPSPEMAYESVRHISQDVPLGYWVRGLHYWGANLMIIAVFLHMIRVFFTRAYRKPRELNWILGTMLLGATLTMGFTGYSLTYNQLSYWATTVGTNLVDQVPLIGHWLLTFMRGGETVSANTLTRFFVFHELFVPAILFILIALHIFMIHLHGVAELEGHEGEGYYPFYPDHFLKGVYVTLFLLTVMSSLAVLLPPALGQPANPAQTPLHIKPEWYFYAVYGLLKWVPIKVGVTLIMAGLIVMVFWPFIDDWFRAKWPKAPIGYAIGGAVATLTLVLTVVELLAK